MTTMLEDRLRDLFAATTQTAPVADRVILARADGVCESGTESIFWNRIQPFDLDVRRQVVIGRVGRVDFVVGERLVVEIDGAAYHADSEQFEADRRRDAMLSRLGYRVLRFSYTQVMFRWAEVEAALIGALVRGDHR